MIDIEEIIDQHQPNTPREFDSKGRKVNEPVQCRACLEAWPCIIKHLLDRITELTIELSGERGTWNP